MSRKSLLKIPQNPPNPTTKILPQKKPTIYSGFFSQAAFGFSNFRATTCDFLAIFQTDFNYFRHNLRGVFLCRFFFCFDFRVQFVSFLFCDLFCVRLRVFILYKAHTHIYAHARVGKYLFTYLFYKAFRPLLPFACQRLSICKLSISCYIFLALK